MLLITHQQVVYSVIIMNAGVCVNFFIHRRSVCVMQLLTMKTLQNKIKYFIITWKCEWGAASARCLQYVNGNTPKRTLRSPKTARQVQKQTLFQTTELIIVI